MNVVIEGISRSCVLNTVRRIITSASAIADVVNLSRKNCAKLAEEKNTLKTNIELKTSERERERERSK
jgi:hypothetical protein